MSSNWDALRDRPVCPSHLPNVDFSVDAAACKPLIFCMYVYVLKLILFASLSCFTHHLPKLIEDLFSGASWGALRDVWTELNTHCAPRGGVIHGFINAPPSSHGYEGSTHDIVCHNYEFTQQAARWMSPDSCGWKVVGHGVTSHGRFYQRSTLYQPSPDVTVLQRL